MTIYDVIVVGGGPAGSMAALTAAGHGLSVLLVERDNVIGSPVRCAEAVDHKGLIEFFKPDPAWVSATVYGYSLVSPDGIEVEINIDNDRGYVLERAVFDRMVAEKAADAGAKILTGTEAAYIQRGKKNDDYWGVLLHSTGMDWTVNGRIVIAADGVESRVARWAGLKTHASPHDMETCAQVTLAGADIDPHVFKLYFTGRFAPGGYAWVFPKGERKANVGLGISGDYTITKSPKQYLHEFLARYFPEASIVGRTNGGIPCTGGLEKAYTDGLMVVGDAAHLANPISGGGIINALISGRLAGETAAEALKKGDASEAVLRLYEKHLNDRIGKMNRRFYRLKEGIFNIPDDRLNEIAREIVSLPKEKRTPVQVLKSALIKNPDLLLLLAKVVF